LFVVPSLTYLRKYAIALYGLVKPPEKRVKGLIVLGNHVGHWVLTPFLLPTLCQSIG